MTLSALEPLRLRTFKVPLELEERLSNQAAADSCSKAELARKYLDLFFEQPSLPASIDEPLVLRSYYLSPGQDETLKELSLSTSHHTGTRVSKGALFRTALARGLARSDAGELEITKREYKSSKSEAFLRQVTMYRAAQAALGKSPRSQERLFKRLAAALGRERATKLIASATMTPAAERTIEQAAKLIASATTTPAAERTIEQATKLIASATMTPATKRTIEQAAKRFASATMTPATKRTSDAESSGTRPTRREKKAEERS